MTTDEANDRTAQAGDLDQDQPQGQMEEEATEEAKGSDWSVHITATATTTTLGKPVFFTVVVLGKDRSELLYRHWWRYRGGPDSNEEWTGEFNDETDWGIDPPHTGTFRVGMEVKDPKTGESHESHIDLKVVSDDTFQRPGLPSPDAETVIKVEDVSMIFNIASEQFNSLKEYFIALSRHELKFKEFRALDHINFEVKRGEAFGLVGTNGSGKSTMLKIIAGVLEASEGTCEVKGTIAPLIELGAGFDMELTAKENIYLNGALLGYRKEFIDEHFDDIVEFAELQDFLEMPLKNYSSGMVARIAFAIATITEPDILIVDETLSVGDFLFQQKCERRIRELVEADGVTVLLVSHSIDLVERICDRVCWIEKGKQKMLGPTDEVCDAYKSLGD